MWSPTTISGVICGQHGANFHEKKAIHELTPACSADNSSVTSCRISKVPLSGIRYRSKIMVMYAPVPLAVIDSLDIFLLDCESPAADHGSSSAPSFTGPSYRFLSPGAMAKVSRNWKNSGAHDIRRFLVHIQRRELSSSISNDLRATRSALFFPFVCGYELIEKSPFARVQMRPCWSGPSRNSCGSSKPFQPKTSERISYASARQTATARSACFCLIRASGPAS